MIYTLAVVILFLLLFPMYIGIGILIVMISGFPIMYRQRRIGKNGKLFVIYKFRSMYQGAEEIKHELQKRNEARGPVFKIHNDPRLTRIGKFLSHTGLDELPQLYNVLRGEMALIGPRPLPVAEAKQLKSWMHEREHILPGIISPAILSGNYHKDFDAWMKSDVSYIKTKNIRTDFILVVRSVWYLCSLFWHSCVEVLQRTR